MKTKIKRVLALILAIAAISILIPLPNGMGKVYAAQYYGNFPDATVGVPYDVTIEIDNNGISVNEIMLYTADNDTDYFKAADFLSWGITQESTPHTTSSTCRVYGTFKKSGTVYLILFERGSAEGFANRVIYSITAKNPVSAAPAAAPANNLETKNNEPEVQAPPCEHTYEWQTITAATATADGEEAYVCTKCGDVKEKRGLSAMDVFDQETANKILKAGQGATVNIECKPWNTFGHAVKDAMLKRSDVTVKASFLSDGHKGIPLKVTLPAGSASLFDQNGYLGLCNAGSTLGYDQ